MACRNFWSTVQRKRIFSPEQLDTGNLKRCLNRWDLTNLGVGSTLGIGVYVLLGYVALNLAGPSVVLSFLVAAVAASLAGLCYAEFGSRIPRAGSAYIYTYVGVGELAAFFVGWNNIMEGLFGTASIARGLSMFVDSMVNSSMSEWFTSFAPIDATPFSGYFDFFSFFLVLILGALLAFGMRESAIVNNALTAANVVIIIFIIIAGSVHANSGNWYLSETEVPTNYGSGGFFPYGVLGTMKGAAVCFYGFVGFDIIASIAEEARDPRKSIPMTILLVLGILFCIYASVAIVITMMVPYYQQDSITSVATVFSYVGWEWARWSVSVGAICGISASLIVAMVALPRLLYAMSSDGLSLHWFRKVTKTRKSPAIATIVPTVIIAVLAAVLDINQLLMMMSIGTLLSYTFVAISVIALRYRSDVILKGFCQRFFPPSVVPSRVIYISLTLFILVCIVIGLVTKYAENVMIPLIVLHIIALLIVIIMSILPKVSEDVYFKTPLVPFIPCISIYVNIQLMILINVQTWIRVAVWILIGIFVYIICLYFYKRNKNNYLQENMRIFANVNKNGKVVSSVQIVVEEPTPPGTERNKHEARIESAQVFDRYESTLHTIKEIKDDMETKREEIIIQQAVIENNDEKEAKIIDLLDQVLQAEEDSYEEIISLKDDNIMPTTVTEGSAPRKSLGELSDAGSDASLGNQVLSKYDVIAQVHREDLPMVSEEEEKNDKEQKDSTNVIDLEEQINEANKSETNSRTDESGYSDTFDKGLNDSSEDVKEMTPYIPPPPPPLDESFFAQPFFKKSYSMPKPKMKPVEISIDSEEENKPRESVKSTSTQGDDHMVFGSEKQMNFMSKLSNIFQNKLNTENEKQEMDRKRSNSIGNVTDNKDFMTQNRPLIFEDLKKEIIASQGKNLKPVNNSVDTETNPQDDDDENEDLSMTRQDLKSKLESIFANGGTKLVKPRLMKSNPPTPEEAYQTEASSTESIHKNKKEKNDTLKRQKAKFSEVLNSFRLSFNNDDKV
ncbi:LOW QUALITY PROTEIN: cationic amino acid transporter 2 [Aphomia sociella]